LHDPHWASLKSESKSGALSRTVFLFGEKILMKRHGIFSPNKKRHHYRGALLLLLRSRADSNRCSSFCRAEPSHSATGPLTEKQLLLFFREDKGKHFNEKQKKAKN
jgi:hypothetical protein